MGGSSSGFFRNIPPGGLTDWIDETYRQTISIEHDITINGTLSDLLIQYNDRDVELVQERLNEIEKAIEDTLETRVDLNFGGSIAKHTYVDGLSDVDALAILRDRELQGLTAREVLDKFADTLERELGYEVRVKEGAMAVTVVFPDDMEIQILPAIQTSTGIRIPVKGDDGWSNVIRPEAFATKLTRQNEANGGMLIPVVKLAKAALDEIPESIRPSGYHLESLAVEAFDGYNGPRTYKAMLQHLFERGGSLVLAPIKDSTGQSLNVDEDLGEPDSRARQILSGAMDRIARRMSNADRSGSADEWLQAIGE